MKKRFVTMLLAVSVMAAMGSSYAVFAEEAATDNIINLRKKWKGICSQVSFIVLKYGQGCI